MHRAPCWRNISSSPCPWNSSHTRLRSTGERASGSSRGNSRNPVGLPMTLLSNRGSPLLALLFLRPSIGPCPVARSMSNHFLHPSHRDVEQPLGCHPDHI